MKRSKTPQFRIKEVHRVHSTSGRNSFIYFSSFTLEHEDIMTFIRLHVTPQERSEDMRTIKFFMEHVCTTSVGRYSISEALIASGYKPIKHDDDQSEWKFKMRLHNVIQLFRNKNNSSIISRPQDLPTELTINDRARGIIRNYRLATENPDKKDELLVLDDHSNLIGLYTIVSETSSVDPPVPFQKKRFDEMLRKWKDLALWKGQLCVGQWVKINWQPENSRCLIISIYPEKTFAYNQPYETEPRTQFNLYTRGPRRFEKLAGVQHGITDKEIKPCPFKPINKLQEFAYYCLYDELVVNPDQTMLADIEMRPTGSRFASLKANVMADTIMLPRLQKAKTDEEAVLAIMTELTKLFTVNGDYQRYGHYGQYPGDNVGQHLSYREETRKILLQFLADFEVAKPWLGVMYKKPVNIMLEDIGRDSRIMFDPYYDEQKILWIIYDYIQQDTRRAEPVFCYESQWFAIYRVLLDLGIIGKSRHAFVKWINDCGFDDCPQCLVESMNKTPRYFRTHPYLRWNKETYCSTGKNSATFSRYYDVARYFDLKFTENDMRAIIKE